MRIVAKGEQGLSSTNDILASKVPPENPECDQYWLDKNFNPPRLKQYNCDTEQWELVQMDVEELDPDTFEDIDYNIKNNHEETMKEINQINKDAANLKKQVEDNHERDTKYFEEVWKNIDEVEADLQKTNEDMHNMNIQLSDEIDAANDDIISNRGEYLGLYGDVNGKHSILAQNVNGIASRVSDAEGNISKVTQTANAIGTRVTNTEGDISTLSQNAKALALRVSSAEGNISTLTVTSNGLSTKVEDNRKNITTVTQTATALGVRLSSTEGNVTSLTATANSLSSRMTTAEGNYSSLVQTVKGMQSTVTSITDGTASIIKQMSDSINLRVTKGDVISQIGIEADKGVYIAGKAIRLDGNVKVDGTFVAPKVISSNSDGTEYTKIENRSLVSRGYYSNTWRGGYAAGNHELTANVGYIKMQQMDGSYTGSKPALYYTSRGISTYFGANNSASGSIEFFAPSYSASVNGLAITSSGNIMLESTASSGSHIFVNPNGGKLHVCNKYMTTYYDVVCNTIDAGALKVGQFYTTTTNLNSNGDWIKISGTNGNVVSKGSVEFGSGGNIKSDVYNKFYFGNFYTNDTNINSKSDAIKIGGGTGNIVCNKLTETSARDKKKNIANYDESALDVINSASIRTYQYLDDKDIDIPYIGLILDEAPLEVVDTTGNGVLPSNGVWLSWKATQELSEQINKLTKRVQELELFINK